MADIDGAGSSTTVCGVGALIARNRLNKSDAVEGAMLVHIFSPGVSSHRGSGLSCGAGPEWASGLRRITL